jgi:hypothetical protein
LEIDSIENKELHLRSLLAISGVEEDWLKHYSDIKAKLSTF